MAAPSAYSQPHDIADYTGGGFQGLLAAAEFAMSEIPPVNTGPKPGLPDILDKARQFALGTSFEPFTKAKHGATIPGVKICMDEAGLRPHADAIKHAVGNLSSPLLSVSRRSHLYVSHETANAAQGIDPQSIRTLLLEFCPPTTLPHLHYASVAFPLLRPTSLNQELMEVDSYTFTQDFLMIGEVRETTRSEAFVCLVCMWEKKKS